MSTNSKPTPTPGAGEAIYLLARFRRELYFSFGMRRDALFDVADALAAGPGGC